MKAALSESDEAVRLFDDIRRHPKPAGVPVDPKAILYLLGESYTQVAVCHYRLGDVPTAQAGFQSAYEVRRQAAQESPNDPAMARAVGYSLLALADASFRLGDLQSAAEYHRQALELRERLFAEHPADVSFRADLSSVNYMIGDLNLRTGNLVEARSRLERSRDFRAALVESDPRNVIGSRDLAYVLLRLGDLSAREKDETGARRMFQAALQVQQKLDIAQCFALCARADNPVLVQQTYMRKAIDSLRAAIANGYRDRVFLETEPELDPLRTNADFHSLLAGIAPWTKSSQ
jgi:tetratricopeptide (TPR) repeat protein